MSKRPDFEERTAAGAWLWVGMVLFVAAVLAVAEIMRAVM